MLLTGETEGYYEDYADSPAERLARCLKEGFVYQGEPSPHRGGKPRGTPSGDLPPTAFVFFLQNHDQIGNRAFGERLTALADPKALEAAIALQLLCPQIPLIFMGEEKASKTPFLFFTDHNAELAQAVRDGRRREFSSFPQFSDQTLLAKLPDPNAIATFEQSRPHADPAIGASRLDLYRRLLDLRRTEIIPRLKGAKAIAARALGATAVTASWRMADDRVLSIACNLGADEVQLADRDGRLLFASSDAGRAQRDNGPARTLFHRGDAGPDMNDAAIRDLARRAGLAVTWRDYANNKHEVSIETLRRLLAALDLPCETAGDVAREPASM